MERTCPRCAAVVESGTRCGSCGFDMPAETEQRRAAGIDGAVADTERKPSSVNDQAVFMLLALVTAVAVVAIALMMYLDRA
jgi:hypothetical protein